MRRPTQMEAFDAMYSIAAADGRGEALFGDCQPLAREAFCRSLIGEEFPTVRFELPLLGELAAEAQQTRSALWGSPGNTEDGR